MIGSWLGWSTLTLALAAGIHWAAIAYAPTFIMSRVMGTMSARSVNAIVHNERATAGSRVIVKPSPDLLYSQCVFDLSRAPLRVATAAPAETYWSVAFYADNTDNFFVLNDTQARGNPATIMLIGPGHVMPPQLEGVYVVSAPSTKGVVLFRTLINENGRELELDRQRRMASCQSMR